MVEIVEVKVYSIKQVNMTRKYHNHTLQTNPRHREDEQQNTNSHKAPGGGGGLMQFNGKTIFLLKQMLVYVDILKNCRLTSSAGYRPTSLGYIVRYWLWRK